ncbi:hypothetical protein [Sphaerisporangium corydalis]|uniref:Uncharacterized protein n=1 Tax=Sphaerisporangium corydalis TaxID=1441875 RepID=A0ABV9EQW5_9ACTN|nr:hypothetical protein [Sphaerisporangium corydalis]
MTHQYNPQQVTHFQQPQRPPKKGFSGMVLALALVGGLAVGCIGGVGIGLAGSSGKPIATTANVPAADNEPASEQASAEPSADHTPKPSEFRVTIKVIKSECFSSAGAIVTYRAQLAYSGNSLPEDKTFTVSYKISGGQDPATGAIDVTGDEISRPAQETIQTPTCTSALRAKVTQVL